MSMSQKLLVGFFWIASGISVLLMARSGPAAWDCQVYWNAIQSLRSGGDPYAEGIAVQQAYHDRPHKDRHDHPPMTYVYSPMTLPALRLIGKIPERITAAVYGALLIVGFVLQLWASWHLANERERRWLPFVFPAVAFFPGLLNDDVLLSGNIAYILYGLILAAAVPGWKRNRWGWFYLAVLVASCCKAPLLSLLALPVLVVGRRQWLPAISVGASGVSMFFFQQLLWPTLFKEYLQAVELQFSWNLDFGVSPSGILGKALVENGLPYSTPSTVLYLAFAAIICLLLFLAARRLNHSSSLHDFWLPTAIIGTILLNPRIKEYDVAAITVPMLLIAARIFRILIPPRQIVEIDQIHIHPLSDSVPPEGRWYRRFQVFRNSLPILLAGFGWFLAANFVADGDTWKPEELTILLLLFSGGICVLFVRSSSLGQQVPSEDLALQKESNPSTASAA